MPRLPVWIAKPLREGWATTFNQMLQMDYPPGRTKFEISPKLAENFWLVYGWNYGRMENPDGVQHYSADFKFVWIQSGIQKFRDYMVPSMMDFTYPVFLTVTKKDPVTTVAENDTGETQTIDFSVFLILFDNPDAFQQWTDWFDARYGVSPLKLTKMTGEELKATLEALRRIPEACTSLEVLKER